MSDLKKQARKKLQEQFQQGGFTMHTEGDVDAVRLWLYSAHAYEQRKQPRMVGQASLELYRAMTSTDNWLTQMVTDKEAPDGLLGVIRSFDKSELAGTTTEPERQLLTAALARYAIVTKSWELNMAMVGGIGSVPGIHVVIVDWVSSQGAELIRPFIFNHKDAVMSSLELKEMLAFCMDKHFGNRPGDR